MRNSINNSLLFAAYFAILIIVLLSWKEMDAAPPMYQRVLFVAASLMPGYFYRKTLLPVLACFSTVSFYGYSHSFFPAELIFILLILIGFSLIERKKIKSSKKGNVILLLMAIYTAVVDVLTSGAIQPVSLSFFAIFIFGVLFDSDEEGFRLFGYALCLTSIILSYEFYHVGDEMIRASESTGGFSRVFLRDPNYLGAIIAAGAVVAFREQLGRKNKNVFEKLLYVSTIILSFITIVLNASRGAMLSVSLCFVLLLVLYPTKTKYKVLIVLTAVVGTFFLYQNGYFDLLQYRVETDSGTGSNRTVIWGAKISTFLQEGSIFNLVFGFGNIEALSLGINAAFHNDFVAMLVEYGIVGFVLFVIFLLWPILRSNKNKLAEIAILVLFLVVAVSTIEPISAGRYAHLFFYVYIEELVLLNKKHNASVLFNAGSGNAK